MGRDIEGKNVANPVSMLLSAVFMLRHLGLETYASAIQSAVMETLSSGSKTTADVNHGKMSTTAFTGAIIEALVQTKQKQ